MGDVMQFPKKWKQFLHDYEFEDSRQIYTNGARLIPSFRVKQMMEHYLSEAETRAKAEAIKEIAEKLENKLGQMFLVNHKCVVDAIDNIVKEMVGEYK